MIINNDTTGLLAKQVETVFKLDYVFDLQTV